MALSLDELKKRANADDILYESFAKHLEVEHSGKFVAIARDGRLITGENFVRHFCPKHFIVRTSGLFGIAGASGKGGNFVETMLKLAKEREELKVVSDQVFSPTYTKDLARKIAQFITTEYYGIFHVTNKGSCSWYEFTKEILKLADLKIRLIPITSEQYPQKAKRPHYPVLDNYHLRLLGMDDMRTWQRALRDYMIEKGCSP